MSDLSKIDLRDDAATEAPEAVDPTQNLLNDGTADSSEIEEPSSGGTYY